MYLLSVARPWQWCRTASTPDYLAQIAQDLFLIRVSAAAAGYIMMNMLFSSLLHIVTIGATDTPAVRWMQKFLYFLHQQYPLNDVKHLLQQHTTL